MAIGGSGTEADPWTIGSSDDLVAFAADSSYWASGTYAELTADIDMDGVTCSLIGNNDTHVYYQGTFDGGNHTVSNYSTPMFGALNEGVLRRIHLVGSNVSTALTYWAFLANYAEGYNSVIEQCSATNCHGTCTASMGMTFGALLGDGRGKTTMRNCYASNCSVTNSKALRILYLGGVGAVCASITNSYTHNCTWTVTLKSSPMTNYQGGIGGNVATISDCAINGGSHLAMTNYASAVITNCYSSETTSSETMADVGFWNGAGVGGTAYLSWDFTTPVWYWDSTENRPVLRQAAPPVTAPAIRTKVSGTWKNVDKTLVKVNGTWKEVSSVFTKVSGEWKEV